MSKSQGTTQTTQKVNTGPWGPQQPYLIEAFEAAKQNYGTNKGNQYFPGSTVAGFNPTQDSALGQITDMQTPNVAAAQGQNLATVNGDYLNANPYLDRTFDQAASGVTRQFQNATAPQTDALFAGAGRSSNSGARYNAMNNNNMGLGTTLDNLATSIYGGNYANERQNQQAAVGAAPALSAASYIAPQAALQAGNQQQAQAQNVLTSDVNRFNFNQQQPTNALNTYLAQIQGNYGENGTKSSETPYFSNPGASAIGGISSLAGAASSIASLFKSDRRLKSNVVHVGRAGGLNVYEYDIHGRRERGLMAQEVARVMPQAVVMDLDGFLMVDYARALV